MDSLRALDVEDEMDRSFPAAEEPHMDPPPAIGTDERRMHVRAYNYWVSLLHGRSLPSIADLDPDARDFGCKSVLLDFTADPANPAILYLGEALRAEGELELDIRTIADVPRRSLVSRLTDHYLEIIANRAPVGFEAEYINERGSETLYRGIMMPFAGTSGAVDYVFGVINWKERAAPELVAGIAADLARSAPAPAPIRAGSGLTAWAEETPAPTLDAEPLAGFAAASDPIELTDQLALARQAADGHATCEVRARAALYRALSTAYDLALCAEQHPRHFHAMLGEHGLRGRAAMAGVVRLVFNAESDRSRLATYATVLRHARRRGIASGAMRNFLENQPGGVKAIIAAERDALRNARARG